MTKLLNALRRTLADTPYQEPEPHFHQGTTDSYPEVCYVDACERPRLSAVAP
jgi:hypothetical protein